MKQTLTLESTVEEAVVRYPQTVKIFLKHGIPCMVCGEPLWGTIGENAQKYNVKDTEQLLKELNDAARESALFVNKNE